MALKVKLRRLQNLGAKLTKMHPTVKAFVKQALAEGADETVATMKSLAPEDTGKLRESIQASFEDGSVPAYAAFVGSKRERKRQRVGKADPELTVLLTAGNSAVRYAHLVEFGTAPHINGGLYAGSKHPGSKAQPFFFPGYRANRRQIKAKMRKALKRGAEAVARGN